eukprot:Gb_31761 [translate_table: standard]
MNATFKPLNLLMRLLSLRFLISSSIEDEPLSKLPCTFGCEDEPSLLQGFGISLVYQISCLVHAYAVARDMRGAVACVDEMQAEDVELNLATYSILISGYANIGDAEPLNEKILKGEVAGLTCTSSSSCTGDPLAYAIDISTNKHSECKGID